MQIQLRVEQGCVDTIDYFPGFSGDFFGHSPFLTTFPKFATLEKSPTAPGRAFRSYSSFRRSASLRGFTVGYPLQSLMRETFSFLHQTIILEAIRIIFGGAGSCSPVVQNFWCVDQCQTEKSKFLAKKH